MEEEVLRAVFKLTTCSPALTSHDPPPPNFALSAAERSCRDIACMAYVSLGGGPPGLPTAAATAAPAAVGGALAAPTPPAADGPRGGGFALCVRGGGTPGGKSTGFGGATGCSRIAVKGRERTKKGGGRTVKGGGRTVKGGGRTVKGQ